MRFSKYTDKIPGVANFGSWFTIPNNIHNKRILKLKITTKLQFLSRIIEHIYRFPFTIYILIYYLSIQLSNIFITMRYIFKDKPWLTVVNHRYVIHSILAVYFMLLIGSPITIILCPEIAESLKASKYFHYLLVINFVENYQDKTEYQLKR